MLLSLSQSSPWSLCVSLWSLCVTIATVTGDDWPDSTVTQTHGHYPSFYLTYTHVMLVPGRRAFVTKNRVSVERSAFTGSVWSVTSDPGLTRAMCGRTFDEGHAFTFFYYHGQSNYFHLHYDTAIPLYRALRHGGGGQNGSRMFMPTVETRRLEAADWQTEAYSPHNKDKYWAQVIKAVTGDDLILPLDQRLIQANQTICFRKLYIGSRQWKQRDGSVDPGLIRSFVRHIQREFDIKPADPPHTKIGIIKRTNRRRILNEPELVEALGEIAPTELVDFSGRSFREQVSVMQDYRVVVGMNGAGLMNCLYLPPSGVCVQLVPYQAELNHKAFGELLATRGHYRKWHNTHAHNHVSRGTSSHSDDTIVNVTEILAVVREAVTMATPHREEL